MRRALSIAAALIALFLIWGTAAGESRASETTVGVSPEFGPGQTNATPAGSIPAQVSGNQEIDAGVLRGRLSPSDQKLLDSCVAKKTIGHNLLVLSAIWTGLMVLWLSMSQREYVGGPIALAVPGLILGGVSIGLIRDGQKGIEMLADKVEGQGLSLGLAPCSRGGAMVLTLSF